MLRENVYGGKKKSYARVWMLNVLGTKPLLILHFEVPLYIHYFQDTNQSFLEKKICIFATWKLFQGRMWDASPYFGEVIAPWFLL